MSSISKMVTPDGAQYDIRDAAALKAAAAAPAFSSSAAYAVGDVVTKDGLVYRCSTAHSAAAWNAAHFTVVDQLIAAGGKVNASLLPAATTSAFGAVKPDGTTITVSNGVITAVGGGGGGGGGSSLSGCTYDFSTNAGLYISARDMVVVLGGSVTNFPTIPNAPSAPTATSSSLNGRTYDFSTNVGLYTAVSDAALALGGTITNFPTIPNA